MDFLGLVFDFDGTMCRLFKNYNLNGVVEELHNRMKKYGYDFSTDKDAFEIFEFIGAQENLNSAQKIELYEEMDNVLVEVEKRAVKSCELVSGVNEIIPLLKKSGYKIGVATNNSVKCVSEFLKIYCGDIDVPVVGRIGGRPDLMKPNPWSLLEVIKKIESSVEEVVFLGDTKRDYECAIKAGCKFIGVAPTEKKLKRLQLIEPKIDIVSDFYELKKKLTD